MILFLFSLLLLFVGAVSGAEQETSAVGLEIEVIEIEVVEIEVVEVVSCRSMPAKFSAVAFIQSKNETLAPELQGATALYVSPHHQFQSP